MSCGSGQQSRSPEPDFFLGSETVGVVAPVFGGFGLRNDLANISIRSFFGEPQILKVLPNLVILNR